MNKFTLSTIFSLTLVTGCQLSPKDATSASDPATNQVTSDEQILAKDAPVLIEHEILEDLQSTDTSAEHAVSANDAIVTYNDLWERMRSQLHFQIEDNPRIDSQRNWYAKHQRYIDRVGERAEPFLYLIVERIEARGLPIELALLPIVESAFDPFAYSHGRASGMWQFVPATGKKFGLEQNWWYDGRRDIVASTDAALDYLSYLHKRFNGNWLHALAAYNSGEGRVSKAIRSNKRKGKATDFWHLSLPKETRDYVPKLLALAQLLAEPDKYGISWYPIKNEQQVTLIEVGTQIDLAYAADLADMSVRELHAYNPGYNRWATAPEGPHTLLLPISRAETFTRGLAETTATERLNWVRYKIQSGDSLIKIANKFNTAVDVISQVNDLKTNVIRAGQFLLIPVAAKSMDEYSLAQDQRIAATKARKRADHKISYTVKQGDTLWDISRLYKVNLRQLAKWNGIAPTDPLRVKQKLVIWLDDVAGDPTHNGVMRTITYKVRSGDSMARIAQKFKVKIADIERWNQLNRANYLQPGQQLKLFVDVTKT